MMENKNIDYRALGQFINTLPELSEDEVYYVITFERGKYKTPRDNKEQTIGIGIFNSKEKAYVVISNTLKGINTPLKPLSNPKHNIIENNLSQISVVLSNNMNNNGGVPNKLFDDIVDYVNSLDMAELVERRKHVINNEAMATYIHTIPRSLLIANLGYISEYYQNLSNTLTSNGDKKFYLLSNMFSLIQHSKTNDKVKQHITIDIDVSPKILTYDKLYNIVESTISFENVLSVIQTRGGYHLLFKSRAKENRARLHHIIRRITDEYSNSGNPKVIEVFGDSMSPCVGVNQGGYKPTLLYHNPTGNLEDATATSLFWNIVLNKKLLVISADAWDGDLEWSFETELITQETYLNKLDNSVVIRM